MGAKVSSTISSNTNLLISGISSGSKKLNRAREKGIKVITENEWLELIKK